MKKISLIIFLTIIFFLTASCGYEDLGLKEIEAEEIMDFHNLDNITSEDFFYRLKTQQSKQNPLSDINVRKAIMHAINREQIVYEIMGEEYAEVLNSLFNENSPFYYPAWNQYDYNPQLARDYLERAGYSLRNPLYLTIGYSERSQVRKVITEMVRDDLIDIGILLWVEEHNTEQWYSTIIKSGDYDLGIWALYNYDGSELEHYFGSQKIPPMETSENRNCHNFYWYRNEDIDRMMRDIPFTESLEHKKEIYNQIQQKLADDAVVLPLYSRLYTLAHNNKVGNISINPENGCMLAGLENWTADFEDEDRPVVIGYEDEPMVINPFVNNPLFNRYINEVLFNGLWSKNIKGEYDNVLVSEYSRLESKVAVMHPIIRVKLLDNIYWEDGSPIDSEDVYYTWKAAVGNDTFLRQNPGYGKIEDIEIINDREFNIVFNERMENWQDLFSTLIPAEKYLEYGQEISPYNDLTVANGPYKVSRWAKGQYILLERNDNYRGPKPAIKYLQFVFNSDTNQLINALKAGDIDVLSIPANIGLLEEIEQNSELEILIERGNLWEHLAFSLKPKD